MHLIGKFRGVVSDTADPLGIGRIRALVPSVLGEAETVWALPCLPPGATAAALLRPPAIGATVWIEFEGGDLAQPIWVGHYFASAEALAGAVAGETAPVVDQIILGSETAQVVTLAGPGGATLRIDAAGITIGNGKGAVLRMAGPSITLNNDALVVT